MINLKAVYQRFLKTYKDCSELPLKNFLKIVETGNLKYLYKSTDYSNLISVKSLSDLWDSIVIEYADIEGASSLSEGFKLDIEIKQLQNLYNIVKAMLRLLILASPNNVNSDYAKLASKYIIDLKNLGYEIDLTNSDSYKKSIYRADKKANNIITRIRIKQKSLDQINKESSTGEKVSFEKVYTNLVASLNINISENITVKQYCEYKEIIRKRVKSKTNKNK